MSLKKLFHNAYSGKFLSLFSIVCITLAFVVCSSPGGPNTSGPDSSCTHNWEWVIHLDKISKKVCAQCNQETIGVIGDTGPGEGIIFYVEDNPNGFTFYETADDDAGVQRYYLEAVLTDISCLWAENQFYTVQNLSDAIGRGMKNTLLIIADSVTNNYSTQAAISCAGITNGGQHDWFLPSKDELYVLCKQSGLLGMSGRYWASSQINNSFVWTQSPGQEPDSSLTKNSTFIARAIRAF